MVRFTRPTLLDETSFVNLFSSQGALIDDGQGLGTILNDDGTAPLTSTMTIADAQLTEAASPATGLMEFTVTHVKWTVENLPKDMSSPILVNGLLYRLARHDVLHCRELSSGRL